MNGRKRSGKPGIVQAMQMPPTFGQPPTPLTQPRAGTLQLRDGAGAAELGEAAAVVGERVGEAPALGQAGAVAGLVRRPLEEPERAALARRARSGARRRAISSAMRCSVSVIASGCTGQPGRLMIGVPRREAKSWPRWSRSPIAPVGLLRIAGTPP